MLIHVVTCILYTLLYTDSIQMAVKDSYIKAFLQISFSKYYKSSLLLIIFYPTMVPLIFLMMILGSTALSVDEKLEHGGKRFQGLNQSMYCVV